MVTQDFQAHTVVQERKGTWEVTMGMDSGEQSEDDLKGAIRWPICLQLEKMNGKEER